jgi:hypothetical protein
VKQELNVNPAPSVATKQVNGEIKQEKERSIEKTKDAGNIRENNKERSERKSAGRQQQQQTPTVGEMSGGKLSSASKSGVINVTSSFEGKREALSGYVSVVVVVVVVVVAAAAAAAVVIVGAWQIMLSEIHQTIPEPEIIIVIAATTKNLLISPFNSQKSKDIFIQWMSISKSSQCQNSDDT